MNKLKKRAIFGAQLMLAVVSVSMGPRAFAAAGDDLPPQARLNIAGTDFTSLKAVAHLKSRVNRTAIEVCASDWDRKRMMTSEESRCYDKALNNGMAQIEFRRQDALRKTTVNMAVAQPIKHPDH